MKLGKYLVAVGALSLVAAPALAAPTNAASSLSLSKATRAGAPVKAGKNKAAAGGGIIIAAVAAVAVVVGIVVIADDDDDDSN